MAKPTFKNNVRRFLAMPVAKGLAALGVTPNMVTIAGLAVVLGAGYLVSQGWLLAGGLVLLFSGAFDAVDGALARLTGKSSDAGAFLDSFTDRLAEAGFLAGLAWYYLSQEPPALGGAMLVLGAFVASVMVSYARARSEGLGIECTVGFVARTERVLILGIGVAAGWPTPALWIVLALSALTAAQRFTHTFREAQRRSRPLP